MFGDDLQTDSGLRRAVVKLIIFFDLFDYPLTTYEIWVNLDRLVSPSEILGALQADQTAQPKVAEQHGFYFLVGRDSIVATRAERYNYSCRKLKIARRFANLFKICPFIRLVALSNSFGDHNLRDGSDLDFFIVSAPGRIWLSRLYCAGLAKLLNKRPTIKVKRDRVCLSFYITEDQLNLDNLKIAAFDPHFHYWRRYFFPLYDRGGVYAQFLSVNKDEAGLDGPQLRVVMPDKINLSRPSFLAIDYLEFFAKMLQLKILPQTIRVARNKPGHVIINDQVLKFHEHDNRQEILEKYGNKIQQIFSTTY